MFFEHAQTEEGEIVFYGIKGIELTEIFGEFEYGFPVGLFALEEAEGPGNAFDVDIEWDEELCGANVCP